MPLFGKNKETVVNGAVKLVGNIRGMIDDSKFTDEERSRYQMKLADSTTEFVKATLSESTERSRTRRSIAVVSIYYFYFLTSALVLLWKFDPDWYQAALDLVVQFKLPIAFIMIMAFFFGGYYLNKFGSKQKEDGKK